VIVEIMRPRRCRPLLRSLRCWPRPSVIFTHYVNSVDECVFEQYILLSLLPKRRHLLPFIARDRVPDLAGTPLHSVTAQPRPLGHSSFCKTTSILQESHIHAVADNRIDVEESCRSIEWVWLFWEEVKLNAAVPRPNEADLTIPKATTNRRYTTNINPNGLSWPNADTASQIETIAS